MVAGGTGVGRSVEGDFIPVLFRPMLRVQPEVPLADMSGVLGRIIFRLGLAVSGDLGVPGGSGGVCPAAVVIPWRAGYFPVMMLARVGEQRG